MRKIQNLTDDQLALLTQKRDEWIRVGLAAVPADRPAAEAAACDAYRAAGLPAPELFIWLDNPLQGAIAQGVMRAWVSGDQVWDQVWDQVADQVAARVRAQVRAQARDQVGDQVGDQVWDQVWAQVRAQVADQVWDQVRAQVADQVAAQVWDQVEDQVGKWSSGCCWGNHDYWLSFYDTFDALGITGAEAIRGLVGVSKNAGWWWPLKGAVILTERPTALTLDNQGRLHAENGAALTYPGGFNLYMWHGTRVPADLIETGWSVEQIMAEPNTEVRRCAIEKMGWDQFISASGFTLADECDDPGNPGQVLRLYDIPRNLLDFPVRVLVCTNATVERGGTRHTFGLTVPTDCGTAMQAAAWSFGLAEKEYRALERAT
jgi:hypothetical protein